MQNGQSEQGLKPEKFDSDVKLVNVSFSYPSRPTVQVRNLIVTCMLLTVPDLPTGAGQP